MPLQYHVVDAFTGVPFAGNPAALLLLRAPLAAESMQRIAREMNLSETAFLVRRPDGFDLRWFTPAVEVNLCGHATLASAHVLYEDGVLGPDDLARFHTRSGLLTAARRAGWIELDFPSRPVEPREGPPQLLEALGTAAAFVGAAAEDYLVLVDSEATLCSLRPDFARLRTLDVRGVIVTAPAADARFDFVSRFFAPAVGIDEDPVTGSAHCCLAPFWAERCGKTALTGFQASARGGVVRVRLAGERVILSGEAVTVARGEFSVSLD